MLWLSAIFCYPIFNFADTLNRRSTVIKTTLSPRASIRNQKKDKTEKNEQLHQRIFLNDDETGPFFSKFLVQNFYSQKFLKDMFLTLMARLKIRQYATCSHSNLQQMFKIVNLSRIQTASISFSKHGSKRVSQSYSWGENYPWYHLVVINDRYLVR